MQVGRLGERTVVVLFGRKSELGKDLFHAALRLDLARTQADDLVCQFDDALLVGDDDDGFAILLFVELLERLA